MGELEVVEPVRAENQTTDSQRPLNQQIPEPGAVLEAPKNYLDPEKQKRQDIRAFTKSTKEGRKSRNETASQVLEKRKSRFASAKAGKEAGITHDVLVEQTEKDTHRLKEVRSDIETLSSNVWDAEGNLVKRIFRKGSIDSAKKQVRELEAEEQGLESKWPRQREDIARLKTEIIKTEQQRLDANKAAQEWLSKFYRDQFEKLDVGRLESSRENGSVNEIAKKFQVYFTHALKSFPVKYPGKRISEADILNFRSDIAAVALKKPSISTSTIRAGVKDIIWGHTGILLNGGTVEEADQWDLMTNPGKINRRVTARAAKTGSEYNSNIERAITRPDNNNRYNELIVSHPDIAGIFINFDEAPEDWDYNEAFSTAQEFGMRVFVFKDGIAHIAQLDGSGKILFGDQITPEQMLNQSYQIPEENNSKIQQLAENQSWVNSLAA